ncbi:MAG TPA: tyrosine-type recombinase/integrase [Candidatus Acidoferrum sp.]|nr:tyrosine-type recombinase/integrase [Candidatus Acidoferrum sp.]
MPAWLQLLEDGYLRYLTRRGRRAKTLLAYHYEIQDFAHWLSDAGVGSLEELRRPHLEQWQDEVATRKALKTQQVAATAVRGLLKWCADQEMPMTNPMLFLRLDSPRVPSADPRPIPRKDLDVIHEALKRPNFENIVQLRTRALFWILFSSGSRIGAVLSMNRNSIQDRGARVIQKGGRPHTLMFSDIAVESVDDYLRARTDDHSALFIGHHGAGRAQRAGRRFTVAAADVRWALLAKSLGIAPFSSHRIRHSCATTLLRNHVDGIVVAKVLGHRGLATVMNYSAVDDEQRREAVDALGIGA